MLLRRYRLRVLATLAVALIAIVLVLDSSMLGTLLAALLMSIVLGASVLTGASARDRNVLLAMVSVAFVIRVAAAFGVYYASLGLGKDGYIGVDDGVYAAAASMLVDYVRGEPASEANVPPYWAGHAYLMGPYVYLEAAFFFLFGKIPLPVLILNAAAGCGVALLAYDMARRLFGSRAGLTAAALLLFIPSLVAWSALNLKDSLTLLLVTALLWTLFEFQQKPRWWVLGAAFAMAVPIEGLRRWAFYLLIMIIPLAVLVSPRLRPLSRARWTVGAALVSAGFLFTLGSSLPLHQINVGVMENIRLAMAKGARTGYASLPPEGVIARSGDTFVIVGPSPSPGATPPSEPTPTPRTFVVSPGTRIVLATPTRAPTPTGAPTPSPTEPPLTVVVRPGDFVIVSSSAGAPVATQKPKPLQLSWDPESNQISATLGGPDALGRLLAYLPTGTVYALFAPFPWQLGRLADAATIPDMLVWYLVLGAALVSTWQHRHRWRELLAITLFSAAAVGLFAVAEGNTGTLFRHRAMIVPFAVIVASPLLAALTARAAKRWRVR